MKLLRNQIKIELKFTPYLSPGLEDVDAEVALVSVARLRAGPLVALEAAVVGEALVALAAHQLEVV